jgi:hypothetical protein
MHEPPLYTEIDETRTLWTSLCTAVTISVHPLCVSQLVTQITSSLFLTVRYLYKNKIRQCTYNVILRRDRATTLAVEK